MARLQRLDILCEIYELCQDLIQDAHQQLLYFRASVYKNETADLIRSQITALRSLIDLIPEPLVQEPFLDYEAELKNVVALAPGECTFSTRVARLLQNLHASLDEFKAEQLKQQATGDQSHQSSFEQNIYKNREKILAICRPGSRPWAFFQSL